MSVFDRIVDGLTKQLELRGDVDRLSRRVDGTDAKVAELEKAQFGLDRRLIRIETLVEVARGDFGPRRLPQE